MIMELYFEKPSLVLIFYYKDARDFTCYHRHDLELSIEGCRNVIYLYRNPVDTVYSQLSYHKEDVSNVNGIRHWAELYGKHLSKWLFEETFTIQKTVITYEGMKGDMHETFAKVCQHFGTTLDRCKLDNVLKQVSKKTLKKKTKHDFQVINLTTAYEENKIAFRERFSSMIYDVVCAQNEGLRSTFRGLRYYD
jgi:hypothetical protein